MASIDAASVFAPRRIAVLRRIAALVARASAPADSADVQARRALVQNMIAGNPDAFSSEFDVQAMMQHYPGQF